MLAKRQPGRMFEGNGPVNNFARFHDDFTFQ